MDFGMVEGLRVQRIGIKIAGATNSNYNILHKIENTARRTYSEKLKKAVN
jgi:hypothetical protein